jgi:hypothetical protein
MSFNKDELWNDYNWQGYRFLEPAIHALNENDEQGVIIRLHLMIESTLFDILSRNYGSPEELEKSNLSFEQIVYLLSAHGCFVGPELNLFLTIDRFRNRFAHTRGISLDSNSVKNLYSVLRKNGGASIISSLYKGLDQIGQSPRRKYSDASMLEKVLVMMMYVQKLAEGLVLPDE